MKLPSARDQWTTWTSTITLEAMPDHSDVIIDLDGDGCTDPREDETARLIELSIFTHDKSDEGEILIHNIRVVDDTVVGDVKGFEDVDTKDAELAYWIFPIFCLMRFSVRCPSGPLSVS